MSSRLAAAAGALLLATGCVGGGAGDDGGARAGDVRGASTGVTDTTIRIGTHVPLTGAAAPGNAEIPTGTQAYLDHLNAHGGLCGRQVEYVVRDDAHDPASAARAAEQLVRHDDVFAVLGGLGTDPHRAAVGLLNDQQVPDLFVTSGATDWDDPQRYPYTFGWQPDHAVEGAVLGRFVADSFPQARVGLLGRDDDLARDGFAGVRQHLDDQVVGEQTFSAGNTDVGPQVAALQSAGADLVISFSVPAYTALSRLSALRLGYAPQWVHSYAGSDPALVGALLSSSSQGEVDADLLEGSFSTAYLPAVEQADDPWTQLFGRIWAERGVGGELSGSRVHGMAQAYTLAAAVARICDNLNREALVAVLQEQGSELAGPWLAPLDYSRTSHRGISGLRVVQREGGVPVGRTPVLVTDGDTGDLEEHTGAPDEPPRDGVPRP